MKTNIVCPECSQAAGGNAVFHVQTIRDDGLYTGKCPKGHDLLVATQTLRHEMLFEIALNAITDGYAREAVSSFAAAIERYFEFAIRVLATNQHVIPDVFDSAWSEVSSRSERELGAYVFLYVTSFSEVPKLLSRSMAELRNNVIHKGVLPTKEQVLSFGKAAYDVIQGGIQKLRSECLDDVNKELSAHVTRIATKMVGYPRSFQVTPTALYVIENISGGYKTIEQLLTGRAIS